MSYTPTVWIDGQTPVNAENLNKIENGIYHNSEKKLDADALPEAVNDALVQAKASGAFDGPQGESGYTPVRGKDYWTAEDIAFIQAEIEKASDAQAIVCEGSGEVIHVVDSSNKALKGLRICGKTIQNGTPTPETPVELVSAGASGAIHTTVAGKNLLQCTAEDGYVFADVTQTVTDDGSITLQGTSTGEHTRVLGKATLPPGEYLLSTRDATYSGVQYWLYINGQTVSADGRFTLTETSEITLRLYVRNGVSVSGYVFYPYIYHVSVTDATYEPYKEIQTLTAQSPNGLAGIPVSSGGNYTDENGQQWICDYKDYARGVYVQRVRAITFNGTENLALNGYEIGLDIYGYEAIDNINIVQCMCSHYACFDRWNMSTNRENADYQACTTNQRYVRFVDNVNYKQDLAGFKTFLAQQYAVGMPVVVQYVLATPIETALSAEELAQYAALHTNKPNTTVYNDSGAGMVVGYIADTKNYIDRKIAAISAAVLNT